MSPDADTRAGHFVFVRAVQTLKVILHINYRKYTLTLIEGSIQAGGCETTSSDTGSESEL